MNNGNALIYRYSGVTSGLFGWYRSWCLYLYRSNTIEARLSLLSGITWIEFLKRDISHFYVTAKCGDAYIYELLWWIIKYEYN